MHGFFIFICFQACYIAFHLTVACLAWWFWLGMQSNKGGWGQRNCKEIRAGTTRHRLHGRVAFLSSLYACIRIIPIGSECSPVNQIFGNLPWESSKWLNKSSPQDKIKYQRSVDRSIVNLEYWTGKQGNCMEAWTGSLSRKPEQSSS